jgi:hypothetical protein
VGGCAIIIICFFSFGFSDFQDIPVLFYGFNKIMPISKCVKREDFVFSSGPILKKFKKIV